VRYARNPAVLWRSTSQGPVVLIPGRDLPTRLSGLAAVVWEVLDEPLDQGALQDEVATVVDGRPDLTACLAELADASLVLSHRPH
jgi:hypothetical protein